MLATQNPIELEGTYPLPEAQLDRFIFNVLLDYLSAEHEMQVLDLTTTTQRRAASTVTTAEEILDFQRLVRMVPIADPVARYAVRLVRATAPATNRLPISSRNTLTSAPASARRRIWCCGEGSRADAGPLHVSYQDVTELVGRSCGIASCSTSKRSPTS